MPPEPVEPWKGVLNATEDGAPCAQAALGVSEGVEDCLNLYVYTHKIPDSDSSSSSSGGGVGVPVVVWLHGGSFVIGGAAQLDEALLMDRDIVLVVPQYRLGILGFFHTPKGTSSGNMGMLDQVLALQWVRQNIGAFGGDVNMVTLAGDCAGGASALYHMLSPLSEGLFHRVISLSGSPINPWAINKRNHRFMLILANYVKCPAYDQSLTVQCFQEITQDELLDPTQMLCESRDLLVGNHRLAPTVQDINKTTEESAFLTEHPLKVLMESGPVSKVPVLMTGTKNVGTYLVDMLLYDFIQWKMEEDQDFLQKLLPMILKESLITQHESRQEEFQEYYFQNATWENLDQVLTPLAKMVGDIHFWSGIVKTASLLSDHVPTYVMRYDFEGGPNLFHQRHPDPLSAPPLPHSAGHGDEMALIMPDQSHEYTEEQLIASSTLLDMVENFAYGRSPGKDWPLFTTEAPQSLVLNDLGGTDKEPFVEDPKRAEMLNRIHEHLYPDLVKTGSDGGGDGGSSSSGSGGSGRDEL